VGHGSLLVSADVGSSDGTRGQVRTLRAENPLLRELGPADDAPDTTSPGVETRELRMILEQAHEVHARACLVLDASMTSMGADWVAQLARPSSTTSSTWWFPISLGISSTAPSARASCIRSPAHSTASACASPGQRVRAVESPGGTLPGKKSLGHRGLRPVRRCPRRE